MDSQTASSWLDWFSDASVHTESRSTAIAGRLCWLPRAPRLSAIRAGEGGGW